MCLRRTWCPSEQNLRWRNAPADGAAFKIVSVKPSQPKPKFGSAKVLIEVADDFDEPLDYFKGD
jgi:hypothetical protein